MKPHLPKHIPALEQMGSSPDEQSALDKHSEMCFFLNIRQNSQDE